MGDSYEKVKESERVEALRERARIIVQMEKQFPRSHRYCRFMHFVEAADIAGVEQEHMWEGVTKRITQVMANKLEDTRVALADKQDNLEGQLSSKFEMLDAKLQGEVARLEGELNSRLELLDNKLDTLLTKLK